MNRGTITLFSNIFHEPAVIINDDGPGLREKKVSCIVDYYYYKGRETGKSYPLLMQMVSDAFFLSERTIQDIILDNRDMLVKIKNEWKEKEIRMLQRHMETKWPHLAW